MSIPIACQTVVVLVLGIMVSRIDLRERRIPDTLNLAILLSAFVFAMFRSQTHWWISPAAAIWGFAVPWAARRLTGSGLGWGDIKLAIGLSLQCGWPGSIVFLGASSALALLSSALVRSWSEAGVPFGPFLVGGALVQIIGQMPA